MSIGPGRLDQADDALGAVAVIPIGGDQVGVVRIPPRRCWPWRCSPSAGLKAYGQLLEGDVAGPFVLIRPAGDGQPAVAMGADGDLARHLVADIAVHVGVDEVLGRHVELAGRLAEFVPIGCLVETPDGREGRAKARAPSSAGRGVVFGQRHPRVWCGILTRSA